VVANAAHLVGPSRDVAEEWCANNGRRQRGSRGIRLRLPGPL